MKKLGLGAIFILAILLFINSSSNGQNIRKTQSNLTTTNTKLKTATAPVQPFNGGTIVMENIVLRVDTGNPSDPVKQLKIYQESNLVFSDNGCGVSNCSYNLESLASGLYTVVVYTTNGVSFSADINR